ncbi:MAG TPA: NAD-dependent epimerase/dehydratase family protein [Lachnospiraceae bacterium]|nr:NAD-dependent epimerase/dehydratase family protein [Lachnospiraceae bacterium]
MDILVIGGTRFFGIPMIHKMLQDGHRVILATRGITTDPFENHVERIQVDITEEASVKKMLGSRHFATVVDKIAYSSNDILRILSNVSCDRFIHMSSTAVYESLQKDTVETDFDAGNYPLVWCDRDYAPYGEAKRLAESALAQEYSSIDWVAVRYPYVIGINDYTQRLRFYVSHVIHSEPMYVDNLDAQMSFVSEKEAGEFLAHIAASQYHGAINGSLQGTISIRDIIEYVERKTGKKALFAKDGEPAPYNGTPDYSINTKNAEHSGYTFGTLRPWIEHLLDVYITGI